MSHRLLTTKQSMEDLIGTIADHTARDQKKAHNSLERVYFHLCNSKRLTSHEEYKFLQLQRGDLADPDVKSTANRQETFVCTSERSNLGEMSDKPSYSMQGAPKVQLMTLSLNPTNR